MPRASSAPDQQERLKAAGLRLQKARKAAGLNQAELGLIVGLRQSVISDWEKGKLGSWRDYMAVLTRHLKLDASDPDLTGALIPDSHPAQSIVVVGEVQGGAFRRSVEYPPEERFTVPVAHTLPGYEDLEKWALKVVGPSVDLLYPPGSYIIVVSANDVPVHDGDKVVVYERQGELREATVKQLQVEDDGRIALWPRSSHPDFQQPIYLDPGDELNQDVPEIAYVVIGSFRLEDRPTRTVAWKKA